MHYASRISWAKAPRSTKSRLPQLNHELNETSILRNQKTTQPLAEVRMRIAGRKMAPLHTRPLHICYAQLKRPRARYFGFNSALWTAGTGNQPDGPTPRRRTVKLCPRHSQRPNRSNRLRCAASGEPGKGGGGGVLVLILICMGYSCIELRPLYV